MTTTMKTTKSGKTYLQMIEGLPKGDYCWEVKFGNSQIYVARADRNGVAQHFRDIGLDSSTEGYLVRCVWRVNEGYSDNAESFSFGYQPFGDGQPFVGLDLHCKSAQEAAEVASDFAQHIETMQTPALLKRYPTHGTIGNVTRK